VIIEQIGEPLKQQKPLCFAPKSMILYYSDN